MTDAAPRTESQLTVNGEPRAVAAGTSVADLLAGLGRHPRMVAVERNGLIVPRASYAATILGAGDRVEIVAFTQGG